MKKLILTLAIALVAISMNAQTLPKPSPNSEMEQMVGATKIELTYSRPGVKEREVFGGLLEFGKVWRFGANAATKITTEHNLFFENGELPAGSYSVFAIPDKEVWEVIFNKDVDASEQTYNEENDVLRVKVKPQSNSFTETFTLTFDKIKDESASLVMLWEKTRIDVPFTVNTKENSVKNIEDAIKKGEDLSGVYSAAADYYYSSLKDNKTALEYVNKSVEMEKGYRNLFLQARILFELGEKDKALDLAKNAADFAKENASEGYQNFISNTIEKWSK